VFSNRPDIDLPGDDHADHERAVEALDREPAGRAAAVLVRRDGARLVRGAEGELDVELVDRLGHDGISYTPGRDEAVRRVADGEADAALVVRPLGVEEVFSRARAGQTLPQKATYFYPKLVSGLLLQPVDA
jgi:hypothetical protein